jgi:hypothetical protein
MNLHKLKRSFTKKYIAYLRIYNSKWVCSYKSNLVAYKKGQFICPFKNFEDAELYAFNHTNHLQHGEPKLTFRKTNLLDHFRR